MATLYLLQSPTRVEGIKKLEVLKKLRDMSGLWWDIATTFWIL